jgi:hypothetical protein
MPLIIFAVVLSCFAGAAQTAGAGLQRLASLATKADNDLQIDKEVTYREQYSKDAWASYALNPKQGMGMMRFSIVFDNDLRLGLLLEGTHNLSEAEAVFKHNRDELRGEKVAGNDIKSENELYLSHVLTSEGKSDEANRICSYWKRRVRHIAAGQDSKYIYGTPKSPLDDTPELESARWEISCGNTNDGIALVQKQIAAHPHMLASYLVLQDYYYSIGDMLQAVKAYDDGSAASLNY